MATVEERIKILKEKAVEKNNELIRKTYEKDSIEESIKAAREELAKLGYEVKTVEDARNLKAKLEQDIEESLSSLEAILNSTEGGPQ